MGIAKHRSLPNFLTVKTIFFNTVFAPRSGLLSVLKSLIFLVSPSFKVYMVQGLALPSTFLKQNVILDVDGLQFPLGSFISILRIIYPYAVYVSKYPSEVIGRLEHDSPNPAKLSKLTDDI
ncbi:hypothetical protein H375_5240 [Rickettsia prowazekii str. Breinl]|nr:hypothetical protein H374_510 [Rickettsia prowazekii str. NMRC Madrid E]AGJ02750.1 hypothetical protein H375_5240 [Rickettsia prowazekii str. Breinl]EOB09564.1 hypothetical protein H377_8670 [Rickettsia prowazekii str. Cairo 3]EOB09993.1 hypothetical protein H376_5050 [Rickettsia prowazekii str. GvF12]